MRASGQAQALLRRLRDTRLVGRRQEADLNQVALDHAADRTPHGAPIELRPEDFSRPR